MLPQSDVEFLNLCFATPKRRIRFILFGGIWLSMIAANVWFGARYIGASDGWVHVSRLEDEKIQVVRTSACGRGLVLTTELRVSEKTFERFLVRSGQALPLKLNSPHCFQEQEEIRLLREDHPREMIVGRIEKIWRTRVSTLADADYVSMGANSSRDLLDFQNTPMKHDRTFRHGGLFILEISPRLSCTDRFQCHELPDKG